MPPEENFSDFARVLSHYKLVAIIHILHIEA